MRGDGDEKNSNLFQLLQLRGFDDPAILELLQKKTDKYTSPCIQNELLKVMALQVTRQVVAGVRSSKYFTIMADEVTDSSNREQFAICFCWTDENFEPHEDFLGLYKVDTIHADSLVAAIKDTLLRMNLNLSQCRGQCYDGISNMAGAHSGVATQMSHVLCTHIVTGMLSTLRLGILLDNVNYSEIL